MAYRTIKTPQLGKVQTKQITFYDIRGIDMSTQFPDDKHSPDMNGLYRDWFSSGRNCITMLPGFRVISDYLTSDITYPEPEEPDAGEETPEEPADETEEEPTTEEEPDDGGDEEPEPPIEPEPTYTKILGVHFFIDEFKNLRVLVHVNARLYEWLNFNDCQNVDNYQSIPQSEFMEVFNQMSTENLSQSITYSNKLYVLDGLNFVVYDGKTAQRVEDSEDCFVPTTYIARNYAGGGSQYQQRNLLNPKFKNLATGDGTNKEFQLSELELDYVLEVKVNDEVKTEGTDYTVNLTDGKVTFTTAPPKPATLGADNVEFLLSKDNVENKAKINFNKVMAVFDNRIFIAGHPENYNDLRWSQLDDPTYFGELNYIAEGKGKAPIQNIIKVGNNTLGVVKSTSQQDGIVYYHTPLDMNDDFIPKTYPAQVGLAGTGSISHYASATLRDDPLFLTEEGVSAVGKMNLGLERAIEHRSTFVDLGIKSEANKEKAVTCIWRGYYCVLFPSGNMYIADSRMKKEMMDSQSIEYEWFKTSDIGVYEGQWQVEVDANTDKLISELQANIDNAQTDADREAAQAIFDSKRVVQEMRFGEFSSPTILFEYENELFFATEGGKIAKFNADMIKDEKTGDVKSSAFNNNGRKINAYYCTPYHNYGAFNVLKKFEKRGNVLHTKSFRSSWIKYAVRTNKSFWNYKEKPVNAGYFDYGDWDYEDFTYNCFDQISIVFRKLKEKKWQIAQIRIECGKINSAFGIYELDIRVRYQKIVKK